MKTSLILVSAASIVAATTPPAGCAYDNCFWKDRIPREWKPLATTFCKALVGAPPPASTTTCGPKSTALVTIQPDATTVFDSVVVTATQTDGTSCETTVSTSATTDITYPRHTPMSQLRVRDNADEEVEELMKRYSYPSFITSGCRRTPALDKLKAACRCFLARPVVTVTRPAATSIKTLPAQTTTVTTTNTITATVQTCTSTSTVYIGAAPSSCGAPPGTYASATTGQLASCTQPADAPSGSVNAFHRIEADDTQGTVFEGCIYSGPRSITTPSGGTHQCGASTGTSITGQTDAAASLTGFTYDGSFSPSFNDYFITRIGSTQQSGNSYWGVLNNGVFTTSGGCGAQVRPGDSSLWQWDAFNLQVLLSVSPSWAVVESGGQVELSVTARSPNGGGSSPFGGATLTGPGNSVSDSSGRLSFTAPTTAGCYQYKVQGSRAGRSNAFYLNVVPAFPATLG